MVAESKSAIHFFLNLIGRGVQGGKRKPISSENWTFKTLFLIKEEKFIASFFLFRLKIHGKSNKLKNNQPSSFFSF